MSSPKPPLWLLAELTYRCPLHCVYCSNPVDYTRYGDELSTGDYAASLRTLAPDVDYRVVPGVGHFVMIDEPDAFDAMVLEFLEREEPR